MTKGLTSEDRDRIRASVDSRARAAIILDAYNRGRKKWKSKRALQWEADRLAAALDFTVTRLCHIEIAARNEKENAERIQRKQNVDILKGWLG